MISKSFLLSTVIVVLALNPVLGMIKNLGVVGETYPIVEPDVVTELKEQAVQTKKLSDDEFREQIKSYQPEDLHHLPRATMDRTFLVDMTYTLDFMPWCTGSGGSAYPMTGHVGNDNIVQANNTVAARLLCKLNRLFMICDPADNPCGCDYTLVWIKSHYKITSVRL